MGLGRKLQDSSLAVTTALGNGAVTVSSAAIDLENGPHGDFVAGVDFQIAGPALTTSQLPDTDTVTYGVQVASDSGFSSVTYSLPSVLVQTGAGGAGSAAASIEVHLPANVGGRYFRVQATNSANFNASAKSFVITPLF